MKGIKVKLFYSVSLFVAALAMLIIGVWAVEGTQNINFIGSVNFNLDDTILYVKDLRVKENNSLGGSYTIDGFMPGYINDEFSVDVGSYTSTTGAFTLYFDLINCSETVFEANATYAEGDATIITSGTIAGENVDPSTITSLTPKSGTLEISVVSSSNTNFDLSKLSISLSEVVYENFIFDGSKLIMYYGDEKDLKVPSTYSLKANDPSNIEKQIIRIEKQEDLTGEMATQLYSLSNFTAILEGVNQTYNCANFEAFIKITSENFTDDELIATLPWQFEYYEEFNPFATEVVSLTFDSYINFALAQAFFMWVTDFVAELKGVGQTLNCTDYNDFDSQLTALGYTPESTEMYPITITFDNYIYVGGDENIVTSVETGALNKSKSVKITLPATVQTVRTGSLTSPELAILDFERGSQLTTIEDQAFVPLISYSKLICITIPENVTFIGEGAIASYTPIDVINRSQLDLASMNTGLEAHNIILDISETSFEVMENGNAYQTGTDGITRFVTNIYNCKDLKIDEKTTSGKVVTEVVGYAMLNRTDYESVEIPSTIKNIGGYAFGRALNLTATVLGAESNNLKTVYFNATEMNDLLDDSNIFASALFGDETFTIDVYIGANVKRIPANLFGQDYGNTYPLVTIDNVFISDNSQLVEIGDYAFADSRITSITIPSTVTSISSTAFDGCNSLVEVVNKSTLPFEVGNYGTTADYTLLDVRTDESQSTLVESNGNLYKVGDDGLKYFVKNIDDSTQIVLDSDTDALYRYCLYSRIYVTSVSIPEGVVSIGDFAFNRCSGLTEINLPSTLQTIGSNAFWNTEFTSITIPASVNYIGIYAFGISEITSATFENPDGWSTYTSDTATTGTALTLSTPSTNANYLKNAYRDRVWKRA